ncbi:MAG: hypothetical protein M5U28_48385, partial [Sandaracinaceae bacterium]|nr:hypothetical protein [Sandaracinaceae bacterium]
MKLGDPVHESIPWVRAVHHLDEARAVRSAGRRLDEVRRAAEHLGDELRGRAEADRGAHHRGQRSHLPDEVRVPDRAAPPLPLRDHAAPLPPRCRSRPTARVRNILFNPTDRQSSRETPFFQQLIAKVGWAEDLIGKQLGTVEDGLR